MTSPHRRSLIVYALWANATLGLLCVLALVVQWASKPAAADLPPLAGGAGIYLASAQLSNTDFGAFAFDNVKQVLMVYQFDAPEPPTTKGLRFVASRGVGNDLELTNFGTKPSPAKVRERVEREKAGIPILPGELEE